MTSLLTRDWVGEEAGDCCRCDALVHGRLVCAVEQVPDVPRAVLLGDKEDAGTTRRPVARRVALVGRTRLQHRARLKQAVMCNF